MNKQLCTIKNIYSAKLLIRPPALVASPFFAQPSTNPKTRSKNHAKIIAKKVFISRSIFSKGETMGRDDGPMQPLGVKNEINVALLEQIKEQVLAHPEHVNMREWIRDSASDEESHAFLSEVSRWLGNPERFVRCNTTACIAGWAVILSPSQEGIEHLAIETAALKYLGLNHDQGRRLFFPAVWPLDFAIKYHDAETAEAAAQAVAVRIDHFIQTNGAE